MLDPNHRSLLADNVRPPPGYRFAAGAALTYSLDLTTLLTVPVQLVVLASGKRDELLKDPVALLEALRRTMAKLVVVCQRGRIHVPGIPHVLYGLLEKCVVEVTAPHGGVFHPKLWALRYEAVEPVGDATDVLTRLVVLSRNLTPDRSWDLSLSLEGHPQGRPQGNNRALAELLSAAPDLVGHNPLGDPVRKLLVDLADQVRRTRWDDLPSGFDEVTFTVLGLQRRPWKIAWANKLAVISPFVSGPAIEMLAESTNQPVALVSRPEELARIPADSLKRFGQCLVLHDQAETDDGEDAPAAGGSLLRGLHAKVYVAERGWDTTLALGSANATSASLLGGLNVEVLAELTGKRSKVGGVERLLGPEGMGGCLVEFAPPSEPAAETEREHAEKLLEATRDAIGAAGLRAACAPTAGESNADAYTLTLTIGEPVTSQGVAGVRAWPVSVPPDRGVDAAALLRKEAVVMGPLAAASLTGFIAIELTSSLCDAAICFVLSAAVDGMPAARDAAVLRTVVNNRDGFLRYLLMLLRDDGEGGGVSPDDLLVALGGSGRRGWGGVADALPLLEELTRAFARDPARLASVKRMVDELLAAPGGAEVVAPEFLDVWRLYEAAMTELQPPAPSVATDGGAAAPTATGVGGGE